MTEGSQLRGLQRVLAQEIHVSDLLQHLTDLDPAPWQGLIGFEPRGASRERKLAKLDGEKRVKGTVDLLLQTDGQQEVAIELKVGHEFSADQQERYERSTTGQLYLCGLAGDSHLVSAEERWKFLALAEVFHAWASSQHQEAAVLAKAATAVIRAWDDAVEAVFSDGGAALDSIRHKFLARVVARRIAHEIGERGWLRLASVSSGSSGTALVQAFAPIQQDEDRCLIAEVRWLEGLRKADYRIGVDYSVPESPRTRAEVWELAKAMDESIRIDSFREYLSATAPELDRLLTTTTAGRGVVTDATWAPVVERGFASKANPDGVDGNRRSVNPGFAGDGTRRFEAVGKVDLSRAGAADLVELLDAGLRYLVDRLPADAVQAPAQQR